MLSRFVNGGRGAPRKPQQGESSGVAAKQTVLGQAQGSADLLAATTLVAVNPNLSAPVNRWQAANRKVLLAERAVMSSFHRALRKEEIEAEDQPGEYAVTIYGKSFHARPLLTQMWASATGGEYSLKHQVRSRASPFRALADEYRMTRGQGSAPRASAASHPRALLIYFVPVCPERRATHAVVVDGDRSPKRRHPPARRA